MSYQDIGKYNSYICLDMHTKPRHIFVPFPGRDLDFQIFSVFSGFIYKTIKYV